MKRTSPLISLPRHLSHCPIPSTFNHPNAPKCPKPPQSHEIRRQYSLLSRVKSLFAGSTQKFPVPPRGINALRDLDLKQTNQYMQQERLYFDAWKHATIPKQNSKQDYVAPYFASMTPTSGISPEMEIRDGYFTYFLPVGEKGKTMLRVKQEHPEQDPPALWKVHTMYQDGDPSVEVLIDDDVLMRHHEKWLMDEWGVPVHYEVMSVSYTTNMLMYSIRADRESHQCGVFVRNVETDTVVDAFHPDDVTFTSSSPEMLEFLQEDNGQVELDGFVALELAQATDGAPIMFYVMLDGQARPFAAVRHWLGTNRHEIVHYEKNPSINVDLRKTSDEKYITLYAGTNQDSFSLYVKTNEADGELKILEKRRKGVRYYVEHHDGYFYILTNSDGHEDLKVMRAKVEAPQYENWEPFGVVDQPTEDNATPHIIEVEMRASHLVLYESHRGNIGVRCVDYATGVSHLYQLPLQYGEVFPAASASFDSPYVYFSLSSLVSPKEYCKLNVTTGEMSNFMPPLQVPLFRKENFQLYQVEVSSSTHPEVQIPITVAHHRRVQPNKGDNKIVLVGYGAYRQNISYPFQHHFAMLLNKGYILAFAHCRGGGELGESWYDAGRLFNKMNTFQDYVDCAEYFVREGWVKEKQICARGTSAGALTVAVAANWRPELFGSVVMHVPFLDVISTMSDASLPNTVAEYEEFGDATEPKMRTYMQQYAPIENLPDSVRKAHYFPNVYITASESDDTTPVWNALKYAAQLRQSLEKENMQDSVKVLLNLEDDKGHNEYSPQFSEMCDDVRCEHGFIASGMTSSGWGFGSDASGGEQV